MTAPLIGVLPSTGDYSANRNGGDLRILATERVYLYVDDVTGYRIDGTGAEDPFPTTRLTPAFAFVPRGTTPVSGTVWTPGDWASASPAVARILVGAVTVQTGGVLTVPGDYDVYLTVTGATESPQDRVARLVVS